jgi:isopentenyldiphosphate isomerase
MSFLDHIRACNRWEPGNFLPFRIGDAAAGQVRRGFVQHLRHWPEIFRVGEDAIDWVYPGTTFEDRSAALAQVLEELDAEGAISHLHGELYPVTTRNRQQAHFLIDRACAPYFGVRAFGQHLNGFVRTREGLKLWVARRSADRRIYPNHLDNLVAGGLPWGVSLEENLRKECREEADMPESLAARAVEVSAVTYCRDSDRGLKPDVIYCYDLELPSDFEPRCNDGEVESFALQPVEQVMETVRTTDAFKLNCNLVIVDFLIRHGLIPQDSPDYLDLIQGLRSPLP